MKRILSLILAVAMLVGMLPTFALAVDTDEPAPIVFDFACTVLLNKSTGASNGKTTVRDGNVKNFVIDSNLSAPWTYVAQPGVNTTAFQENGLLFYTANKEETVNSNAVVFSINIPADGTYSPSVEGHNIYAFGEKTDVYLVSQAVVTEKGWDVTKIADISAAIGASSMDDPAADVMHIASYEAYPNPTVKDELAERVNLLAGNYYMFVTVNEGSTTAEHASRTNGMIRKLMLTPVVESSDEPTPFAYDFACTVLLNKSTGASNGKTTVRDGNVKNFIVDSNLSESWTYVAQPGVNTAAFQENGLYFYTANVDEPLNNNAVVFTINVPTAGTYAPSVEGHRIYANGEKTDIYLVSKAVVEEEGWNVTTVSGVQAAIAEASMSNPEASVKHIASYDTYYQTMVEDKLAKSVSLSAGDYYMFVIVNEGSTPTEHASRTCGMVRKLIFTPYIKLPELTAIEADFGDVHVGNKLSAEVKWLDGDQEIADADGGVEIEIIDGENDVLVKSADGDIYAIAEGEAEVRVSGTLDDITKSVNVEISVLPAEQFSGVNQDYYFYSGVYQDYSDSGITLAGMKGTPLTEAQFSAYPMRDYGTDRPWGMVAASLTRPNSAGGYLVSTTGWTDLSGRAGDWVAYKVKVPKSGKYNVDVKAREYAGAGRLEIYMVPYTSDMTFSLIKASIDSYCKPKNLVANADFNGSIGAVVSRAFAGQFVASNELDYSAGYAEYLMIAKQCYSDIAWGNEYILLNTISLVGTQREVESTATLSADIIGVGEAVTVKSVTGKLDGGGSVDFTGATFIYQIAEEDKDILEFDAERGEIIGLSEGVGTVIVYAFLNGTITRCEAEVTVDDDYSVYKTYLYTNNKVTLGEELLFTTGYELKNRKVFAGGTIESLEIFNESEDGIAEISKDGKSIRAKKAGTFEVKAKIKVRGQIIESVPEKIVVYSEEVPSLPSSSVEINFVKGKYPGDNFDNVNDITEYTDFRPWIFHGATNLNSSYTNVALHTEPTKFGTMFVWATGANLFNSYAAFKVKFPKTSTYIAGINVPIRRTRSAAIDLYIMPATEEFESNILKYAVPESEYYVGTHDFYTPDPTGANDETDYRATFGSKEVTEGEHLVVYRCREGKGKAGGDCLYVSTLTFEDPNVFGSVEIVPEGEDNVIALGETVDTSLKLKTVKDADIEYADGDITAVVYESENSDIATVDENGAITGINEGETKITATVTYDGITKKAEYTVFVSDNSGIAENGIMITASDSISVYGETKLGVKALMNSGNILDIPDEYITWEIVEGSEYVELSEGGNVYGLAVGTAVFSATVSADYKNGAAEGIAIEPFTLSVILDAAIDPLIYTMEARENAKKNTAKYSWVRDEVNAIKETADAHVKNLDKLYELVIPEGLPRYYHVGHKYDPNKWICRYCEEDIAKDYGSAFVTDAINDPWKIQCPACKRRFPSNDFGSFYKLGLADDGTFLIDRALQKHHEKFVCEDVMAGKACSHIGKFPSYPTTTPGTTEWKAELKAWNNARESREWKDHYGYNVKGGYLTNDLHSEMDKKLGVTGWGVDDGFGYKQPYISLEKAKEIAGEGGDVLKVPGYDPSYFDNGNGYAWYANESPVQYTYIGYFIHNGLWYAGNQEIRSAINTLAKAFVYTGEPKYGRAGAILLDRVADFFPGYDWFQWHTWRGDDYYGTIVDPVWSTFMTYDFALAYDAFKPIYNDPAVVDYLSARSPQYEKDEYGNWVKDENGELIPVNLKDSPGAIMKNAEDNLLIEIFERTKYAENWGNYGMHQKCVAAAAVALNRLPESGEMIDWIFANGPAAGQTSINNGKVPRTTPITGGMFMGSLIGKIDRDGSGNENSPGYNRELITHFMGVADLLRDFDLYPQGNLYNTPKFTKMFTAQIRLLLGGYYTSQTGDFGAIGGTGLAIIEEDILNAYKNSKEPLLAQALWFMKETRGYELRGNILDEDPNQITKDIEEVIRTQGKLSLPSELLAGYGFAALRAGKEYESASETTYNNTHRDFAMYFGKNDMHGHSDALNLFADAFGLNIAPDIGYPEETGMQPNRYQWVRTTLSHNTVVVDEKEQDLRQQAQQRTQTPIHFDDSGRVKLMDISADVYSQTEEYRRSIVMVDVDDEISYGVDFFHIKGGNDHLYSFHSQSDELTVVSGLGDMEETPMYTDEAGNLYGTYAGPNVMYGPDPGGVLTERYPLGYTWLRNVRTYKSIDKDFTVEFNVKDWKKVMKKSRDVRLRLTMLNDEPVFEVSFAKALPPNTKSNKHAGNLEYMLVRNRGTNLDTVFTTVFEPYDATNKYVESIEKVSMVRNENSKPGVLDAYSAVKVTLKNGRVDYVIYSTNNAVDYVIDDKIAFRGFAGVMSLDGEDNVVYSYLNDGEVLKLVGSGEEDSLAAYTGKIQSFTEELSMKNYIVYKPDAGQTVDTDALAGKYVFVNNDGVRNGAYRIESASVEGENIKLNIGDVTLIREYVDANNQALGYKYNIEKGNTLRIPVSTIVDTAPIVEQPANITTSVGSAITVQINAAVAEGRALEIIGTSLPRGASIDEETGVITWKPTSSQTGDNHFAVTASDGISETTVHFTVTVYGSTTGAGSSTGAGTGSAGGSSGGGAGGGGSAGGSGSGATAPSDDKKPTETPDTGKEETTGNEGETSSARFIDLGAHAWAADSINALASSGIIKGTSETTFSPAANITRADFALLLVRAFKLESENTENFADVNASDYFATELAIARNTGLVNGIGDNKFAPRNTITRQDMMVIVYRALEKLEMELETGDVDYADFDSVAEYAKDAVSALIASGLVNGKSGKIAPTDYTTRAEVAVLIKRILDLLK